jgi:putative phosphoesterase
MRETPVLSIGIVTDTHVPDRFNQVSPDILSFFKKEQVAAILHAGDISSPLVVDYLERIAPVKAVLGNRDWAFGKELPLSRVLTYVGVRVGIAHGHGGWKHYLLDKIRYIRDGYQFERYEILLNSLFPDANVIIFGHTHRPEKRWIQGRLFFNPGAAYPCKENGYHVQAGLLRIFLEGRFDAEFFSLSNAPPPRGR